MALAVHVMPDNFSNKKIYDASAWRAAVDAAAAQAASEAVPLSGFQVFLSGPVGYNRIADESALRYFRRQRHRVVVHSPYIPNFMHDDPPRRAGARKYFAGLLHACRGIRAEGLVIHLKDAPAAEIAAAMREILALARRPRRSQPELEPARAGAPRRSECVIFLETEASARVHRFSELQELRELLLALPDGVGICIDTAHLHAQGYDIGETGEAWIRDTEALLATLPRRVPLLLHFNDNMVALGAHRDQHAAIGRGEIWKDPSRARAWVDWARRSGALVVLERKPELLPADYEWFRSI
jgi:endonuclease IV